MKAISWNVNGLRAVINKGFYDFLKKENPDILALQEIKMQKEQQEIDSFGYKLFWNSALRKGYSGTLIFSKKEPINVIYGMYGLHNEEGRLITLEFEDYYFVTCYTPNSKEGLLRLPYRMEFEDLLREYLNSLKNKKHVIFCGDLNVAHQPIDLKNPDSNQRNPGFTIEERNKFTALLDSGFIDTWRMEHQNEVKYTWWSYRFFAREKGIGWRIDYFLTDKAFKDRIIETDILDNVMGSDHCPVKLVFE